MNRLLRTLFFVGFVRPLVLVVIGLRVRNRDGLPKQGPAFIVANHNSHLDALTLMTLFPLRTLRSLRPVAAADYFMRGKLLSWFATKIIGILPIERTNLRDVRDPLAPICEAIERREIVILFPEGTRGEPGELQDLKSGVAHCARRHPEVPVVPVFMRGLGKCLPKGEGILVPVFCDVFVGDPVAFQDHDKSSFMSAIQEQLEKFDDESRPARDECADEVGAGAS